MTFQLLFFFLGFGRFHYLVLLICGLANASDAVEILCVSFILPAAECDLNLSSNDKGYLSACLFLGRFFLMF
jgi:VNT family MFS transporter (synaptic vesicle glycoprotein 2)